MIEKKYRRYFIFGYLNFVNVSRVFVKNTNGDSFVNRKIRAAFSHLGIKPPKGDYSKWVKIIAFFEVTASILIIIGRFLAVLSRKLFTRKIHPQGLYLQAPLIWPAYRIKDMLRSLEGVKANTIRIPFIKNTYREREINILSVITISDIWYSFVSACVMVFFMEKRFSKSDILFRSYSSFEYFLTCCFVKRTEGDNKFIYYNTFDRWAFLMCGAHTEVTFIQHGKLDYLTTLIRIEAPNIAYYVSPEQQKVVEDTLFTSQPSVVRFRKVLQFTRNELLNRENGKRNVLIVSVVSFIKDVSRIVDMLAGDVNLYVKPHPSDKVMDEYMHMAERHGVVILEKTAYPEVDVVISYNSTLADEYDLAGVKVIRWDLLKDLSEIKDLVLSDNL